MAKHDTPTPPFYTWWTPNILAQDLRNGHLVVHSCSFDRLRHYRTLIQTLSWREREKG